MEGLLFPIIMLAVTLLGGGIFLLVLKHQKPKRQNSGESTAIRTAQEFINVRDVKDKYLYTKDGLVLTFLRIHSISIDLYSKSEKHSLIRQLTAELSDIQYPFKFMAVSRPVDISPLIADMLKRAALLAEKFSGNGIGCDVLTEKEIIRLLNLVNNPSYTHLEDTECSASIPTLKEDIYA